MTKRTQLQPPWGRALSTALVAGTLLTAPVAAEEAPAPIPLPENGVNVYNVATEDIRVHYDTESRRLSFTGVSNSGYTPASGCNIQLSFDDAEAVTLPTEQWRWNAEGAAVDWMVILDESDSMRWPGRKKNRRYYLKESLTMVRGLLKSIRNDDTLQIRLVSSKLVPLGNEVRGDDAAARQAMEAQLNQFSESAGKTISGRASQSSFLYELQKNIENVFANSRTEKRRYAIVLFTDADDDASMHDARQNLIQIARRTGVSISAGAFYHVNKLAGVNNVEELCRKTGGIFTELDSTPDTAKADSFARSLDYLEHRASGSFSVILPENTITAEALHIKLTDESGNTTGELVLSTEALHEIHNKFAIAPPPPTEAETALRAVFNEVTKGEETMAKLLNTEYQEPWNTAQIMALVESVRAGLDTLRPAAARLKNAPADELPAAFELLGSECTTLDTDSRLERIRKFSDDKQIATPDDIQESHLLAMLGRRHPLPEPQAPAPKPAEPTPEPQSHLQQYPAYYISGGAVILILIITTAVCAARKRRNKKQSPPPTPPVEEAGIATTDITEVPISEEPLAFLENADTGQRWPIRSHLVNIGRDATNHISLDDPSVSAIHCVIKLNREGVWTIVDSGSKNKIYANKTICRELILHDGTEFELGYIKLRFTLPVITSINDSTDFSL